MREKRITKEQLKTIQYFWKNSGWTIEEISEETGISIRKILNHCEGIKRTAFVKSEEHHFQKGDKIQWVTAIEGVRHILLSRFNGTIVNLDAFSAIVEEPDGHKLSLPIHRLHPAEDRLYLKSFVRNAFVDEKLEIQMSMDYIRKWFKENFMEEDEDGVAEIYSGYDVCDVVWAFLKNHIIKKSMKDEAQDDSAKNME